MAEVLARGLPEGGAGARRERALPPLPAGAQPRRRLRRRGRRQPAPRHRHDRRAATSSRRARRARERDARAAGRGSLAGDVPARLRAGSSAPDPVAAARRLAARRRRAAGPALAAAARGRRERRRRATASPRCSPTGRAAGPCSGSTATCSSATRTSGASRSPGPASSAPPRCASCARPASRPRSPDLRMTVQTYLAGAAVARRRRGRGEVGALLAVLHGAPGDGLAAAAARRPARARGLDRPLRGPHRPRAALARRPPARRARAGDARRPGAWSRPTATSTRGSCWTRGDGLVVDRLRRASASRRPLSTCAGYAAHLIRGDRRDLERASAALDGARRGLRRRAGRPLLVPRDGDPRPRLAAVPPVRGDPGRSASRRSWARPRRCAPADGACPARSDEALIARGYELDGSEFLTRRPDRLVVGLRTASGTPAVGKLYPAGGGETAFENMLALWRSSFGERRDPPGLARPIEYLDGVEVLVMEHLGGRPLVELDYLAEEPFRSSVELLAALQRLRRGPDVGAAQRTADRQVAAAQGGAHRGARPRVRRRLPRGGRRRRGGAAARRGARVLPRRLLAAQRPAGAGSPRADRLGPPEARRPGARRRPLRRVVLAARAPRRARPTTGRRSIASSPPTRRCAPSSALEERLDFHLAAALLRMVAARVELWREESYLIPQLIDGGGAPSAMKVTVLSHDLSTNAGRRTHRLAGAVGTFADVKLIGPESRSHKWLELPDQPGIVTVRKRRWPDFYDSFVELVEAADGDVLIAVKPHLASFAVALVAAELRDVPVILDIDDLDVALAPRSEWVGRPGDDRPVAAEVARLRLAAHAGDRRGGRDHGLLHGAAGALRRHGDPAAGRHRPLRSRAHGPGARAPRLRVGRADGAVPGRPARAQGPRAARRGGRADPGRAAGGDLPARGPRRAALGAPADHAAAAGPVRRPRPALYAAADVVAIPQLDTEAARHQMPLKAVDAMAMGRPIVASAVSDLPERAGRLRAPASRPATSTRWPRRSTTCSHDERAGAGARRRARGRAASSATPTERVGEQLSDVVSAVARG